MGSAFVFRAWLTIQSGLPDCRYNVRPMGGALFLNYFEKVVCVPKCISKRFIGSKWYEMVRNATN